MNIFSCWFRDFIYIYISSFWKNILLHSALNHSSHVKFNLYSTICHHVMDKVHVTEEILEATI